METASWLLLYAGALGWIADPALARAAWLRRSPRVGLWMCHATSFGVFVALASSLALLAHDVTEHGLAWALHADKALLHAAYAEPGEIPRYWNASALLLLMGVASISILASQRLLRARRTSRVHRLAASSGLPIVTADGVEHLVGVCDSEVPAIYCLAGGEKSQRIQVTTGALEALDERHLRAAIEHEQGHLTRQHHLMMMVAQVLGAALRWCGMLRHYPATVGELVELDADDFAANRHGARVVAAALLQIGTAWPSAPPRHAASWTGGDPAARIRRLIAGEHGLSRTLAGLLMAVAAAMPAAPITALLTPALSVAGSAEGSPGLDERQPSGFVHHS